MKKLLIAFGCIFIIAFAVSVSCYADSEPVPIGNYVFNPVQHPTKPYIYWSSGNTLHRVNVDDNSITTVTIFEDKRIGSVQSILVCDNRVLVHERTGRIVEVLNDETLELVKTIDIPANCYYIATTEKYLFISVYGSNSTTLYSYSIETGQQISSIQASSSNYALQIYVNAAQNSIYYLDSKNHKVTFNSNTGEFIAKYDYNNAISIAAILPDGQSLISTSGILYSCNTIQSLDLQESGSVSSGAGNICFDMSGADKKIYASGGIYPNSFVAQYDYPSLKLMGIYTPSAYIQNLFFINGEICAIVTNSDSEPYCLEKFNPSEVTDIYRPNYTPITTALTQTEGTIDLNDLSWISQSVYANGCIYAINAYVSKLFKFDYTNLTQTVIDLPFQSYYMDAYNGDIYVYCDSFGVVYRFDGETLDYKDNTVSLTPTINPTGMKFGNDGNIYFSGTSGVYSYSPTTGDRISSHSSNGISVTDMVFSPAQNIIYISTTYDGILKLSYSNGVLSYLYRIVSLSKPIYRPISISSDGKYLYNRYPLSDGDGLISVCTNDSSTDLKAQSTFWGIYSGWEKACFDSERNVFYVPDGNVITIVEPSPARVSEYYRTKYSVKQVFCGNKLVALTYNERGTFSIEILNPSTHFAPKSSSLQGTAVDLTLDINIVSKAIAVEDIFYIIDGENWKLFKINYATKTKTEVNLPFQPFDISCHDGTVYIAYRNSNNLYKYNAQTLEYQDKFKVSDGSFRAMIWGNDGYLYISTGNSIYGYSAETKQKISEIDYSGSGGDLLYTHPTRNILYYSNDNILIGKATYNNGVLSSLIDGRNSYYDPIVGLLPNGVDFLLSSGSLAFVQEDGQYVQYVRYIGRKIQENSNLAFNSTGDVYFCDGKKIGILDRDPYYQKGSITTIGDTVWVFATNNSVYVITLQSEVYHVEKFDPSKAQIISVIDIAGVSDLQFNADGYNNQAQLRPVVQFSDGTNRDIRDVATYVSSDTNLVTVNKYGYLMVDYWGGTGTATISITFAEFTKQINVSIISTLVGISTSKGYVSPNFDVNIKEYTVSLPYGTTTVPDVEGIVRDYSLDVEVIPATTLSGATIINVRDDIGTLIDSYSVTFFVRTTLESDHQYRDLTDETQTYIAKTPCDSISIVFSNDTYVEEDFDYIYITDENGIDVLGSPFTGEQLAGKIITVPGTVVNIRLVSDVYYTGYGYKVTKIIENDGIITVKDSNEIDIINLTDANNVVVRIKAGDASAYANDTTASIAYYGSNGVLLSFNPISQRYVDGSNVLYFEDIIQLDMNVEKVKIFYWTKNSQHPISMRELY